MKKHSELSPRERLVIHVQNLERLQEIKDEASENLKAGFDWAKNDGYDPGTLRVVLKLRRMTESQRRERRALEAIYLAALGMLEGESLPNDARKRLDEQPPDDAKSDDTSGDSRKPGAPDIEPSKEIEPPQQPSLVLKDPAEARQEGADAAAAGKRVYDNPYPAGDPCRAAWDEGWCGHRKSNGMETPAAYQRRAEKPKKDEPSKKDDDKGSGDGDAEERGAA